MTSNTDAFQRPEHPAFRLFVTTALEAFAFLKDLGFGVASCADAANECAIRLTNETTGVEIRYDMPNIPTVSLARLKLRLEIIRTICPILAIVLQIIILTQIF